MKDIFINGTKIFLRYPMITGFIILGIITAYTVFIAAIATVIPPEVIKEVGEGEPDEMIDKVKPVLFEDIRKTILAVMLFGIIMLVVLEFVIAGTIGLANLANTNNLNGPIFRLFMNFGYVFTPRMIVLELLMSVGIFAIAAPFALAYYVLQSSILEFISNVVMFILSVLLFPTRFSLVFHNSGVLDALKDGIKFGFHNFFKAATIILAASLLFTPILVLPILIVLLGPISFSLSIIWFSRLYTNIQEDPNFDLH